MCVRFGMQSIHVPVHFAFHATTWHDGGIFCRQEPAFRASQRHRAQQPRGSPRRAHRDLLHRDLLPKGSVKHDAMSNSLLKEGMLPYHRTAAITACIIIIAMAIPLTRANRLAAMRDSDERITSIFTRPPAIYVCPSINFIKNKPRTIGNYLENSRKEILHDKLWHQNLNFVAWQ